MHAAKLLWKYFDRSTPTIIVLLLVAFAQICFGAQNGKIVFEGGSTTTGNFQLFTMNPDGTDVVQITNLPANNFESLLPAISPDGQRVILLFRELQYLESICQSLRH